MRIIEDDLSSTEVDQLLCEHLAGMAEHSPAQSIHALDLPALCAPEITFWTAHSLYKKFGFRYCDPFEGYKEDPFSRCMTLEL